MNATTHLETENVNAEKYMDLAISSQAANHAEGSTTSESVGLSSPKCGAYRKKPLSQRFLSKVAIAESGCHVWRGCLMPNGYGQFHLNGKTAYAHRVAYALAYGDVGELFVLHKCDNRKCVNPEHLFRGTFNDNMRDMAQKGRSNHGVKNWNSKLTVQQVLEIRAAKGTQAEIAKNYPICSRTVGDIKRRDSWNTV